MKICIRTKKKLVFMGSKNSDWVEFHHFPDSFRGGIMMGSSPQFVRLNARNVKSLKLWLKDTTP